ncbi:hypothetical protein EYW49_03675 [Siculibacillus lacustris]|uniref:Uncharacterized protein n=1 Tax=Siculibacillus lacustris TaxID=1549641 RepID=A0A4Q9VWL3_9HYPH|nr:hypothetical protein [Siculibacillus lacustris]TBW40291.1 hypothetical protein EYW49_03675 [Siculibacillus lacustris]
MSCDPAPRRTAAGRLALAAVAGLAGLYGVVLSMVLTPEIGEAYRRTYLTGEFSILPDADSLGTDDGLAYRPGRRVSLRADEGRKHLARFDWRRDVQPAPTLDAFSGRLFLHLPPAIAGGASAHRLHFGVTCAMPEGEVATLDVAVDGRPVGTVACSRGPVTADLPLPRGLLGARRYDEITLTRRSSGFGDRILTGLDFRHDAVALDWFGIDVEGGAPIALESAPKTTD